MPACARFPFSSPSAGHRDAAHGAVCRPVNKPQAMRKADEGSEALLWELAGVRSVRDRRKEEDRGKSSDGSPGRPALHLAINLIEGTIPNALSMGN